MTIWHIITTSETVTFTTLRARDNWVKQWGDPSDILCESDVTPEEYQRLRAWERHEASA